MYRTIDSIVVNILEVWLSLGITVGNMTLCIEFDKLVAVTFILNEYGPTVAVFILKLQFTVRSITP